MTTVKSAGDILAEMLASLKVADPELDTSIGSVSRKILDVVAEQIAPAHAMGYIQDWVYSIESKSDAALDDYTSQFGIYRIPARRASGLVTFSRGSIATVSIPVPAGTYVVTGSIPRIAFQTVASAWILKGTKEVTVPVQAVNPGASGNLPVGSITTIATALSGVNATVNQADATRGGSDAESDESLRDRFRKTIFRSIAGTEDMFLGLALEDTTPDDVDDSVATQASVVGPTRHWREQVQVDGSLEATSTFPLLNAKYVYPESSVVGTDIEAGAILTRGVHYDFTTGGTFGSPSAPSIEAIEDNLEEATVYELGFEYVSVASRNDPNSGITNRVDVWVSGDAPEAASEVTYWQPQTLTNISTDALYAGNFVREVDNVGFQYAANGNKFLQLSWGPIIEFPDVLTIDGDDYVNGTDFWVVHDYTAFGLGPKSRFGLEFVSSNVPDANAKIVLSGSSGYFYNRLPADVEERARRWKLVTTDLVVHQAHYVRLILNLAIMYVPNFERGVVQSSVDAALSTFFNQQPFGATIQVSDILTIVHNVAGVDNVRFLNSDEPAVDGDAPSWGSQWVNSAGVHIANVGTTGSSPNRARDVVLMDNQIPVLYDVRYVTKAQNTFGY